MKWRAKNERRAKPGAAAPFFSSFLSVLTEMKAETGSVLLITDSDRTSAGRDVAWMYPV